MIDPHYSRGHDFDADGQVKGLYLVIKGIDDHGREQRIDVPLQVAAVDPKRPEAESRLGRWDFDLQQIQDSWRTSGATDGVHLPIPWDLKQPLGDLVDVYCRFTKPDGTIAMTKHTIDLSVQRSRTELWTPRRD
ncbi:MAG: hypothetical protein R3C05_25920 [Pirellulaceae bacterium]